MQRLIRCGQRTNQETGFTGLPADVLDQARRRAQNLGQFRAPTFNLRLRSVSKIECRHRFGAGGNGLNGAPGGSQWACHKVGNPFTRSRMGQKRRLLRSEFQTDQGRVEPQHVCLRAPEEVEGRHQLRVQIDGGRPCTRHQAGQLVGPSFQLCGRVDQHPELVDSRCRGPVQEFGGFQEQQEVGGRVELHDDIDQFGNVLQGQVQTGQGIVQSLRSQCGANQHAGECSGLRFKIQFRPHSGDDIGKQGCDVRGPCLKQGDRAGQGLLLFGFQHEHLVQDAQGLRGQRRIEPCIDLRSDVRSQT